MATMDQVAWANVNVMVGGVPQSFKRGDLLPEAADTDESSQRQLLRTGGALRIVDVVYTPEELAERAQALGRATAAREVANDVDPSLPLGQQVPGSREPGLPTITEPSGSPVVIGNEETRATHERAAEDAAAPAPGVTGTKDAWVDFAVSKGADRDKAKAMTRDQLRAAYGGAGGDGGA
jgi:hypothetical protein